MDYSKRLEQKESLKPVDGVSVPHYQDGRETTSVDPVGRIAGH